MLVLIAISIGVYSLMEQRGINKRHEALLQLSATAREATTIANLATQLTGVAEQYRLAPLPERIATMERIRGTLEETADKLLAQADKAQALCQRMRDEARSMKPELDRLAESGKNLTSARAYMASAGDELSRALDSLLTEVRARAGTSTIIRARAMESAVLQARLAAARMIVQRDAKYKAAFFTHADEAYAALGDLGDAADGAAWVPQIKAIGAALRTYGSNVELFDRAMLVSTNAFEAGIKPHTDAIERNSAALRDLIRAGVDAHAQTVLDATARSRDLQILMIGLALAAGAVLAMLIARSIVRPLADMTDVMRRLAEGDTGVTVPAQDAVGEIGAMAKAVEVFRQNAIVRAELEAARAADQTSRQRRTEQREQMIRTFQEKVAHSLGIVTAAATELDATARSMTRVAGDTSSQAVASSAAAEQTSANVQNVAAAAEEMVSSLQEIERQVVRSNAVATSAAQEAEATNAAMARLRVAAEQIGAAVTTITDIAAQTNLLALNATIEAARAGEAGRGFAVVAAEVKELAGQTAKATDQIGGQIAAIQGATAQAAEAMAQIARTITAVSEISGSIASTVVQQTAATGEISRNAGEAARGTQDVSATVARVQAAAGEAGDAAGQVLNAAAEMAAQSRNVKRDIDEFLNGILAA